MAEWDAYLPRHRVNLDRNEDLCEAVRTPAHGLPEMRGPWVSEESLVPRGIQRRAQAGRRGGTWERQVHTPRGLTSVRDLWVPVTGLILKITMENKSNCKAIPVAHMYRALPFARHCSRCLPEFSRVSGSNYFYEGLAQGHAAGKPQSGPQGSSVCPEATLLTPRPLCTCSSSQAHADRNEGQREPP